MIASLKFTVTECNGWPQARFLINNQLLIDHTFCGLHEKIDLDLQLNPGQHLLEIVKYGKTDDNCIVQGDTIVQDQTIALTGVAFDDITLPEPLLRRGIWVWGETTQEGSLFWGPNGVWSWHFELPIVPWAVRIMRNSGNPHKDLLDPWHEQDASWLDKTLSALDQLEKKIHDRAG